jgi:hypothetical protein
MTRGRARHPWRTGVSLLTALVLAVAGVVLVLNLRAAAPVVTERCAALTAGTRWYLSPAQADNAALLAAISVRRGLPARAATVAIATALQESKLVNVDHGDRDSIGLFQQRPSQGWGTAAQIMDPVYSVNAFYDVLIKIDGYQGLPITDAAQRVQRSGFPEAYAKHESSSRAWASALTGYTPASVTCTLRPARTAGSAPQFRARVTRDYGAVPTTTGKDGVLTLDAGSRGSGSAADDARLAWSLAQWSVAVANGSGVDTVATADRTWSRSGSAWEPSGTDRVPAGEVRVTLATG